MTDEQKNTFRLLYKFIHDERSECGNLASLIEIQFQGDDEIAQMLRGVIVPYLTARQRTGAIAMELMYELDEVIKTEDRLSEALKDGSG